MDNYRIVLLCEDNFDSIMTGIYDAWVIMNQGREVALEVGEPYNYSMMSEYQSVETDGDKAVKVASSIRKKISCEAYSSVYSAAMHFDVNRADTIFHFLQIGYKMGAKVMENLSNPYVMRILELSRKVGNESHLYKGFVRFSELGNGILFSKIDPKCNVLTMIGDHFCDRFPMENWVIYDATRKISAVHKAGEGWGLVLDGEIDSSIFEQIEQEGQYEKLWKVFFNTIGIESRYNPRCQRTMLPKWYRDNMVEFK